MKIKLIVFIVPLLFFIVSLFTLSDYGISWDEPIHFTRGQAYLHYFLTGNKTYDDLGGTSRLSLYQDHSQTAQYFFKTDGGHPPLNGILAAFSNFIFYQKLGVLGDIESFHLFNVLSASFLVFVVAVFAARTYGIFAGIIAGLVIATYPLFFSEGHFNIKDPAEAAFFGATIWCFVNAVNKLNSRWLLAATLFFAFGLGTKFNILFLPFILVPWILIRFRLNIGKLLSLHLRLPKAFLLVLIAAPLIVALIFFLTWPFLWQNPTLNTLSIFKYYKDIGTGGMGQPKFIIWGGFNLFPAVWILTTTPLVTLFLTIIGIVAALLRRREKEKIALLWLIWLVVPILRVTMPGSSIYGGVRQIMEFIPAMALLSGLGAVTLVNWLKKTNLFNRFSPVVLATLVLMLFIPHLIVMVKMHPNENVYFNSFVGGLSGAQRANVPYWGNSFGNAYYQAVTWLNKNVPPGSRVGLVQGTSVNIPSIYFVPTIYYSNSFWSGINRGGEYLVELTHQGNEIAYPFAWEYVNKVLISVFEVKVDGVAIAKVWKNDIANSRAEYQKEDELPVESVKQAGDSLIVGLDKEYALARIVVKFGYVGCKQLTVGILQTSDNGENWKVEPEKITDQQVVDYAVVEGGRLQYIFPARRAKFIKIVTDNEKSCLFQNPKATVRGFEI